jgi:muconolactone delta-isomerase
MLFACITREDTVHLPPQRVDELKERERQYYLGLKADGKLRTYYLQSGRNGNILIFEVASAEELHRLVMLGPLALYQRTEVYPLLPLPNLGNLTHEMALNPNTRVGGTSCSSQS